MVEEGWWSMIVTSILMQSVLHQNFFNRPTLVVAHDLLGKFLVCQTEKGIARAMITEVEAYDGPRDKACHASKGLTERTAPMFGPAGHWYVYMIYGMYRMLNVVTGKEGYPAAVLIRGVLEVEGPGKLTKKFGIDKRFNALPAIQKTGLWIEERGVVIPEKRIKRTPRIGVEYAGEWAKKEWRFLYIP